MAALPRFTLRQAEATKQLASEVKQLQVGLPWPWVAQVLVFWG